MPSLTVGSEGRSGRRSLFHPTPPAALAWFAFGRALPTLSGVALALLTLALVAPGLLLPLNRLWAWLGRRIAPITNGLVLGLFFYLVLLPAGLAMRLFGADPMARQEPDPEESLWSPVEHQATAESFEDLF